MGLLWSSPGAPLGGLGRLLARSGRLLEPPWGLLGRSWGLPGRAWGSFGPPGGLVLVLFGPLLKAPLRHAKTTKIDNSTALFEVFRGPGGSKIAPESLGNRSQARLGASGGLVGLS